MALLERRIELQLSYGTGPKGDGPPQVVTLSGHRVSVSVANAGGAGMPTAQVRIYGLTLSLMNQLSTIGLLPNAYRANGIAIFAGDDVVGPAKIFEGTIQEAWADMQSAPDVAFNITGLCGMIQALRHAPPISYPGSADAAVILESLASTMGVPFKNHGVSVILSRPYYPGTARQQALAVVQHADIEWNGIENGVLEIWPRNGARGGPTPRIAPETGMVGYPTYTSTGLIVSTVFNPVIRQGALVKVESSLVPASGMWKVVSVTHDIEALMPSGKWLTQLQVAAPGYVAVPTSRLPG